MPRRRPLGPVPSIHHALLCFLVIVPILAAAQQQRSSNNVHHYSPPEDAALDPSDKRVADKINVPIISETRAEREQGNQKRQPQSKGPRISTPNSHKNGKDTAIIPTNERALATFAPVEDSAVRAHPARPAAANGLSSRHPARSLQDWQVEDIVLLATVDGKIHARERYTGTGRWELEVDRPMVQTIYHRNNKSDARDTPGDDDLLWIVEPSQDGALYVYAPHQLGMQKLGLTVKQLVEELSPYAGDDPAVVYTAEKKSTLYTVDAANGNILKTFSSSGSFSNDDRSCRKSNTLESLDDKECEPIGTLTLGRTEYTVAIQDRNTGDPICTISYFEWGPNIRDKDLHSQYTSTLDNRYVYSKYDGSIMALEQHKDRRKGRSVTSDQSLMYSHKFSSPVVRVYDVVRPFDSGDDLEDTPLAILPQPAGPVGDEFPDLDHIFVNQTEGGSWYALSEQTYPLVTAGASRANVYNDEFYHGSVSFGDDALARQRASLVGVHPLSLTPSDKQHIPTISGPEEPKLVDMPTDRVDDPNDSLIEGSTKPWTSTLPSPLTLLLMFLIGFAALAPTQKQWFKKQKFAKWLNAQQGSVPVVNLSESDPVQPTLVTVDVVSESSERKVRFPEPAEETIFPTDQNAVVKEVSGGGGVKEEDKDELNEENKEDASAEDSPSEVVQGEKASKAADSPQEETPPKPEKKARRGVRGGRQAKLKRLEQEQAQQRRRSNSQNQKKPDDSAEVAKVVEQVKAIPANGSEVISVDASESPTVSGKIQINSLIIDTDRVIGHGSAGTCVFEGSFEGRHVAVKRMLSQYYELASQEVSFLQQSDDHENVIRYFCQQKDQHFLYIAVELCQASLWDLYFSDTKDDERRQQFAALLSSIQQDVPKALYQLAAGLRHLHHRRIIHRDIKPQNILIAFPKRFETNKNPRLVISDFGLCKTLPENVSTLIDPTNNAGTCGWKAPELISQPKDTLSNNSQNLSSQNSNGDVANGAPGGIKRAADIFSLGCLFFWVLTGGCHPFDDKEGWMQMRELNIKKNNLQNMHKLDLGSDTEEPMQLISWMLCHSPEDRPTASSVLSHPFFWEAERRLAFLCDVSDHFEREPRDPPSHHLDILESWGSVVIDRGDFLRKLDRSFIDTLGKQRKYTGSRMLDLLRALRNKKNHYEDMPEEVKRRVGALPAGYLQYWTARFPKLLMGCYDIVHQCGLENTDRFRGYFELRN